MSDTTNQSSTTDGTSSTGEPTSTANDQFKPITSQEDLNRIIAARVERAKAAFADYGDLQAKAAKLDEIEQANKSEVEKAMDRAAAAERERDAERANALRLRIAAKHGISDEDADLFLTGGDEQSLTKQAERLASRVAAANDQTLRNGTRVPREGRVNTTASTPEADFGAFLQQALNGS